MTDVTLANSQLEEWLWEVMDKEAPLENNTSKDTL